MDRVPSLSSSSLLSSTLPPNSLFSLFSSLSASKEQHGAVGSLTGGNVASSNTAAGGVASSGTTSSGSSSSGGGAPGVTASSQSSSTTTTTINLNVSLDSKEEEKECSYIIMEIDKGIRSSNLGDQVESIMFYSQLIRYHPTTMVVTSIIIKLADIFRNCSNIVRYRILKVFQECSTEVHRLSNIDEVLKRIHSVTLSNDPLARALALRVLGSVPHLIADKLYVHHTIRTSMQTHDEVEADANYFVMDRLCEVSPVFSDSIIEKINTIIQTIETPPITKLKYTRLFRHMHHNHLISNQSRSMLIELLDLYPSVVQVTLILDTLNTLALKHRLYVNEHITFLINYISKDPRIKVKLTGLKCLQRLAKSSPHSIYPFKNLFEMLKEPNQNYNNLLRYHCLSLISLLSTVQYDSVLADQQYIDLLFEYCMHSSQRLSEQSVEIITNLLLEQNNDQNQTLFNRYIDTICNILSNINQLQQQQYNNQSFKESKLLTSIINFLKRYPQYSQEITGTMISLFGKLSNDSMRCLLHCISIYIPYCKASVHSHLDTLLTQLTTLIHPTTSINDSKLIMSIFITIFRAYDEYFDLIPKITDSLLPPIEQLVLVPGYQWCCYQLAKQSQRHGFHLIAKSIYSVLINRVDTESNYFWLQSLLSIANIEYSIASGQSITPLLAECNTTLLSFKASCSHSEKSIIFQEQYIQQREQYLYNLLNLKLFLVQNSGELGSAVSTRVSATLSKKLLQFQTLAKQFSQFISKLFPSSFRHLECKELQEAKSILETYSISCNLIVYFLNNAYFNGQDLSTNHNSNQSDNNNIFGSASIDSLVERFPLYKICKYLFQQFQQQLSANGVIPFLCDSIDILLSIPANYPSQFFTQIY
ncbi:armadillo-like helical domain-containing protein [Heterostelium album PN500]|uniref:Armadillo-like helical domain-containing protein n=1 Tax=Heterostelium pallidum (strain ATCC 26659 / Pp 5 / PN500) TaxID=670386 RepID=D3BMM7_HETP5|nr:armadillo-like helical domain-containing protein [Heterostelium album PN500]EFA77239.1 armadillo-like helical domain-containing protein [Heterostelium album PN500]|eukprot:XP_020429368.1 armadillo-like helical domain-containing protein [Heterostelium album PN500]